MGVKINARADILGWIDHVTTYLIRSLGIYARGYRIFADVLMLYVIGHIFYV